MNKDGDRAKVSFVVLDDGMVVDVQTQSIPAGAESLQINGKSIDIGSCASL